MKLSSDQLPAQLAGALLPVYLVSGDEPLLMAEAADAIRARARALGFAERQQVFIERSAAAWDEALGATQTLSLFASRRILEIRMHSAKPGHGAAALLRLIAAAGDDLLLLILAPRLDRDAQGAEWVRAVQDRGAWLPLWPIDAARLPGWLRERLRAADLQVSDAALALLAEATEGNLLAARQEIEKLSLRLGPGARVDVAELADTLSDSARFSVFQLTDAIGARDPARALRVLAGLQAEGGEAVMVLWWLVRALHGQAGAPGGYGGRRVAQEPRPAALARPLPMARLVARAARADRVAKGQAHGRVWDELALLAVELCGQRTLPLPQSAAVRYRARA
jgi:DNA polymerase-3 subunit delta